MTRKRSLRIVLLCLVALCVYGSWYFFGDALIGGVNRQRKKNARPTSGPATRWARKLECKGVENFHQVSPTLYRGAQPTEEGMKNLSKMGIKMVISLRKFHSDRDEIGDLPLKYKRITFNTLHPEDKEVAEFLKLVSNPANQPVFVHCLHGSDRTGMMCALYRVAYERWTKEEAIFEWTEGGFGFHGLFKHLVRYFEKLDIESFIPPAPATRPATLPATRPAA
jgi:protein tyrosine phosphatase (PTP) superfamily phosphohydrolase (DUF442 family)